MQEDQSKDKLFGVKLGKNNDIEYVKVDEHYAKENLVWIISTNESIDNVGLVPSSLTNENSTWDILEDRGVSLRAQITEVYITSRKEKWFKGKSDVTITVGVLQSNCELNPEMGSTHLMVKVNKKGLRKWIKCSLSLGLILTNDQFIADDETVVFVIYERDNNPTLTASFPTACGTAATLSYNSDDSYYRKWGSAPCSFFDGCSNSSTQIQEINYENEKFKLQSWEF